MSQSTTSQTPASKASVKPRETAPPAPHCMGCKHWSAITTVEREPLKGNCMRYPPTMFQAWNSGGTDDVRAWILPVTAAEHYCGEWVAPAPAPAAKETPQR
jgi:hypothetical protein